MAIRTMVAGGGAYGCAYGMALRTMVAGAGAYGGGAAYGGGG